MEQEHRRRPRYKGTHPRTFQEKYKEHDPEKYRADVEKIIESGKTPAGMHIPILVDEILEVLQIRPGQVGYDATLGYGGHTRRMLEQLQGMSIIKSFNLTGKGDKRVRQALEDSRSNNLAVEKLFTPYIWAQEMALHLFSVVILAVHPILANTMTLTQQAKEYLQIMVWISAVYVLGPAMNTCWICGVFRAGGDSRFGFLCDLIDMWVVFVPLGFLAAFVFQLPPMWVYALLSLDEFAKMPVVYHRYRQKKWLRNITRDIT